MYLGKPLSERCRETCNYNGCNDNKRLTVGVYYYPWWGKDFHQGNPDNPDRFLREQLIGDLSHQQQLPALGRYNDTEPDVIAKHLKWSRKYNIDLWVSSWWGEDRREDLVIKNNILTHPQLGDHKIAMFYETTGRIREKYDYSLENVRPDLEYLCRQYFNHPNYYYYQDNQIVEEDENGKTNNNKRPVLFVYLTRKLEKLGLLPEVIALMRQGATDGGCDDIFIVGDQVFQGPPTIGEMAYIPFDILDGVTNYDVYGSMRGGHNENGGYVGSREKVTEYYQEQQQWKDIAQNQQCSFIPCASPGFNDRGVRPEKERIPLSRKLNEDAAEGSLFQAALQEARKLVDSSVQNLLMVNSFNEWHEDTQIEPCVAVDGSKGKDSSTNLPNNLTNGLQYEGYRNLYLEILKDETETWDVSSITSSSSSVAATSLTITEETRIPANDVDTSTTEGSITTISDTIGSVFF